MNGIEASNSADAHVDENRFDVAIINNCDTEIYGVHYEYHLAKTPIGGGDVRRSPVTAYETGEIINCLFYTDGFPENADLSSLEIEIYVILDNAEDNYQQQLVGENIVLDAEFGNGYCYSLTGNEADGFSVAAEDTPEVMRESQIQGI